MQKVKKSNWSMLVFHFLLNKCLYIFHVLYYFIFLYTQLKQSAWALCKYQLVSMYVSMQSVFLVKKVGYDSAYFHFHFAGSIIEIYRVLKIDSSKNSFKFSSILNTHFRHSNNVHENFNSKIDIIQFHILSSSQVPS